MPRYRKTAWILIGCLLWTGGRIGLPPERAGAEPQGTEPPLAALARSCPTPEALAEFLSTHIAFAEDQALFNTADYWQAPEELLSRREGDCEDYALLAHAVFQLQGRESYVLSLYGAEGYAHTVCIFVENGRYNVVNQDRIIRMEAPSLETLAAALCPAWNWGALAERWGTRGRALQLIKRSA